VGENIKERLLTVSSKVSADKISLMEIATKEYIKRISHQVRVSTLGQMVLLTKDNFSQA
jgi:hypothetical protein